ncbi:MAG: imelysin family protein [Chitinophagales bacterium]|nr:imelysin family protein [Chitinophagales bacterium]
MKNTIYLILLSLCIVSCTEDKPSSSCETVDNNAILQNLGNIIVDRYSQLNTQATLTQTAITAFITAPTTVTLTAAQNALKQLYLDFETVEMLQFGPAESYLQRTALNNYPTDTTIIQTAIANGITDLQNISNSAKGIHALDYLLFGVANSNTDIVNWYSATNNKNYLTAVMTQVKTVINNVYNEWNPNDGNYYNTFINATGVDIASAFGQLSNAIIADYEKYARDGKVGIPLGIRTLGVPQLNNVEGLYSKTSLQLLENYIINYKSLFNGNNGLGLDDYLNNVGRSDLSTQINNELQAILNTIDTFNHDLAYEITNNEAAVQTLYSQLQALLLTLKVDMVSAMCLTITYQDVDGD